MDEAASTKQHYNLDLSKFKPVIFVLFVAVSYIVCGLPIFETNDDVVMSMIVSGAGFVDNPDYHLVYSHFLIGKCLTALYEWFPEYSWYAMNLIAAQLLAGVTLAGLLSKRKKCNLSFAIGCFLFFCACLRTVELLQFTTTASLLATAGGVQLLYASQRSRFKCIRWKSLVWGAALFVLASLIRVAASQQMLLLTLITSLLVSLRPRRLQQLTVAVVTIGITGLLMIGFSVANDKEYNSNGWENFYTVNLLRGELLAFNRTDNNYPQTISAFKKVGWYPSDVDLFHSWYFFEEKKFSLENLRTVARLAPSICPDNSPLSLWGRAEYVVTDKSTIPILLCIIAGIFFLNESRFSRVQALVLVVCSLAILVTILAVFYLPRHVYVSVLAYCAIVLLWYSSLAKLQHVLERGRMKLNLVMPLLAIIFSVFICVWYRSTGDNVRVRGAQLVEGIKMLEPRKGDLYVAWTTAFPYELISPFDNLHQMFTDFNLVGVNWLARSPINMHRLRQFGIDDLMRQWDHEHIFLISTDSINRYVIAPYVQHEFQKKVQFRKVFANQVCSVYKASTSPSEFVSKPTLEESWRSRLGL